MPIPAPNWITFGFTQNQPVGEMGNIPLGIRG